MRFMDYINLSSKTEEESVFRSLKIGMVKDDSEYKEMIQKLSDKHEYIKESIDILNGINKRLKKYYKGKYKYGFCIEEQKDISSIKIRKNHAEVILSDYWKANDRLEYIKRKFEKDISYDEYFT